MPTPNHHYLTLAVRMRNFPYWQVNTNEVQTDVFKSVKVVKERWCSGLLELPRTSRRFCACASVSVRARARERVRGVYECVRVSACVPEGECARESTRCLRMRMCVHVCYRAWVCARESTWCVRMRTCVRVCACAMRTRACVYFVVQSKWSLFTVQGSHLIYLTGTRFMTRYFCMKSS